MRVAIVHNGGSGRVLYPAGPPALERMSPGSMRRLMDALEEAGHEPEPIEADADLASNLERFLGGSDEPRGVALNRAYGLQGEARYVYAASVLEALGIPYVGTGPLGHALSLDKHATRLLLEAAGLPVPPAVLFDGETTIEDALSVVGLPAIVKPRSEAASIGMHLVEDEDELRAAVEDGQRRFGNTLVERYVPGRELQVAMLGNDPVLPFPTTEVVFAPGGPDIVTREDKEGESGRSNSIRPAELETAQVYRAQEYATRAFGVLGLRDYARADMRLDDDGVFWLLETNSLPGLGGNSVFPYAASLAGYDMPRLLDHLVQAAWERWQRRARWQELEREARA